MAKKSTIFKKVFGDGRLEVSRPKEWRVTTSRTIHKDRKKEASRKACRGRVDFRND